MAYGCEISRDRPREGKQCALIRSRSGNRYGEWYGSMIKSLDAAPYRGKKVRLRGAVRVDSKTPDYRVYLWLGGFKPGVGSAAETMHQEPGEPIRSSEWEDFEIVAEVPNETTRMSCGLALAGEGAVWLDSVSLEALGP